MNPHIFPEGDTKTSQKINVWTGTLGNHIVGAIFIDENLNDSLNSEIPQNLNNL